MAPWCMIHLILYMSYILDTPTVSTYTITIFWNYYSYNSFGWKLIGKYSIGTGNFRWVNSMEWSGRTMFDPAPMEPFSVDGKEAGQLKTYGPLSFLKVSLFFFLTLEKSWISSCHQVLDVEKLYLVLEEFTIQAYLVYRLLLRLALPW